MVVYKRIKAFYLGLKRWTVTMPDGFIFDIKVGSIQDLLANIDRWRKIYGYN